MRKVKKNQPEENGRQSAEAKLECRSLSFYYGNHQALNGVALSITDRQVTAIIGPSGCGKSTLIKSFNRISEVANQVRVSGKVLIDGESVYDSDVDVVELRRRVGMVFQRPNPFPKSVYENVAFGPRIHGNPDRHEVDEIVEKSLRRAALWDEVKDRLNESALNLSGGQQQRVCVARTLAVDPEVILMDEPCSALDPVATAKIEETISLLKDHYCVVIVTHNMQQAARVSDRTAFLYQGELVEANDTEIMFTQPGNKLTEDYITGRFG